LNLPSSLFHSSVVLKAANSSVCETAVPDDFFPAQELTSGEQIKETAIRNNINFFMDSPLKLAHGEVSRATVGSAQVPPRLLRLLAPLFEAFVAAQFNAARETSPCANFQK
jgi:hypothetical protein